VLEFIQHCTYVFPLGMWPLVHHRDFVRWSHSRKGIITKEKASTVKDIPPYIPFLVYFWGSVASVFLCALIIVLNAVLRVCPSLPSSPPSDSFGPQGKKHYKLQNSSITWLFLFNIGGPW
jgi:hypothetical protein